MRDNFVRVMYTDVAYEHSSMRIGSLGRVRKKGNQNT